MFSIHELKLFGVVKQTFFLAKVWRTTNNVIFNQLYIQSSAPISYSRYTLGGGLRVHLGHQFRIDCNLSKFAF